ncbi:MAG: ABC transporter permease, partial [Acidobacteriota bacterium]
MLSLSLGIMATATMVGVVDAIDLRPLPFLQADRLVDLSEVGVSSPDALERVSPGVFADWSERVESVSLLSAASSIAVSFEGDEQAFRAARVSENFFSSLRGEPLLGRTFTSEEIRNAERLAVISHEVWRTRFGAAPGVIGSTTSLSWVGEYRSVPAEPYVIVGVLERTMRYPQGSQVWIPAAQGFGDSHEDNYLTVVGRLAPGESLATARSELRVVDSRLAL